MMAKRGSEFMSRRRASIGTNALPVRQQEGINPGLAGLTNNVRP